MKFLRCAIAASALAVLALTAGARDAESIQKQIDAIKGSDTNAWRQIPWTSSLLAARRASEREKQPLFLFTHDGNIETGRC
jgi:hypothetical protein